MTTQQFTFLVTLLAICLAFGCGDNDGSGNGPNVDSGPPDTVPTDTPVPPGETVQADTDVPSDAENDGTDPPDSIDPPDTPAVDTATDVPEQPDSTPPGDTSDVVEPPDIVEMDTPLTDLGPGDTTSDGPDPVKPLWLLSINNGAQTIQRVDVDTGIGTTLCKLNGGSGTVFQKTSYPSLTFSRNKYLYASRMGSWLDVIDPCTCEVTSVGSYGGWSGVNGITSNHGNDLFGVSSTTDELIGIATSTGLATTVGTGLGVDFGTGGATWSDFGKTLYAINGTDNSLYKVHPVTGEASLVVELSMDFGTVGIELHPANGVIYACTTNAVLREVDPLTGVVTEKPNPIGQTGSCTNLAAPWLPVACVEQ